MSRASGRVWLRAHFFKPCLWWFLAMSRSNRKRDCRTREDAKSIVPAGTPDWITAELIERTIRVWQPYYQAVLTPEDAVQMILSVGRLYEALSSGSSS
jgi:hypothetical protein